MIDSEILKSIIAGIVGGGISISTIPLLFKGDLRFKREYEAQEKASGVAAKLAEDGFRKQVDFLVEQNERLEAANTRLEAELRDQYRTSAEQSREVLSAISFLKSMGGLAQVERRRQE